MSDADASVPERSSAEGPSAGSPSADRPFADIANRAYLSLETLHVVVYFAAEVEAENVALGLRGRKGYFASRSAAMGAVSPEITIATFSVFQPDFVRSAIPRAWELAPPEQWQAARERGASAALHRVLGDPDVDEALALAKTACSVLQPQGRALYAANAALGWPDDPLMALWRAATLLREHRGDGHVAVLLEMGLHPVEAMILHGLATGQTPFLQATRGWPEQDWLTASRVLAERGLIASSGDADLQGGDGQNGAAQLTDDGRALKAEIEARTFAASDQGWKELGLEGTSRLLELVTPLRRQLVASDIFPPGSPLKPQR